MNLKYYRTYVTSVSHKLSFEEERNDSIYCVYILIHSTHQESQTHVAHRLQARNISVFWRWKLSSNYINICSLPNNFDSLSLVSILSVDIDFFLPTSLSTTLFHHQNSFIFFATKKCANFYVYENFFTNTMNFILERQLLVHSGLCEERSKKSSHSKKRE